MSVPQLSYLFFQFQVPTIRGTVNVYIDLIPNLILIQQIYIKKLIINRHKLRRLAVYGTLSDDAGSVLVYGAGTVRFFTNPYPDLFTNTDPDGNPYFF